MEKSLNSNIKNLVTNSKENGKKAIKYIGNTIGIDTDTQLVEIIIITMIGIVIVLFIFWAYSLTSLQNRDCKNLDIIYQTNNSHINSVAIYNPYSNNINKYIPRNNLYDPSGGNARLFSFYVKTAHNCCSPGNYSNSFVSLCALKHNIALGARCLDFEIYSLNLEPIISTSTMSDSLVNSFYIKETFNSLKLSDALYYIKYFALESSTGGATNYSDPLFLHFRIMTSKLTTINLIAKYLTEILGDTLLGSVYGQNNINLNLNNKSLIQFCGKCIIMVNSNTGNINNSIIENSNLWPLINIMTGTENSKLLRYKDIKNMNSQSLTELSNYNKYNMTMVLPDISPENINFDSTLCLKNGCQFVAMNFQTFDANLETYFKVFDEVGFSYILKPCSLRYIPKHYLIDSSKIVYGAACTRTNTSGSATVSATLS